MEEQIEDPIFEQTVQESQELFFFRIQELGKRIVGNKEFSIRDVLLEIMQLRLDILLSTGESLHDLTSERLRKLVLVMQLLDDLVKDRLNIDRMRRFLGGLAE